ncbi:MAG: MmgE/PrpD family protein [Terracidiphilus sp.]
MAEIAAATAVARIAAWSERLAYEQIPEAVRSVACRCLIDTLGVAIAGSRHRVPAALRSFARAHCAAGEASVLGARWRLQPPGAALVNAACAHALDFDDNCYAGSVHGSAVIVPAALAAAEAGSLPGSALLTALVAGAEAEYAVGAALTDRIYQKGWWTTGVLGPVGATVAAARAMHLNAAEAARALGLVLGGTGGVKACFGTDAKPALCGRAAEAGVVAAELAARGITGPLDAIESGRGLAALFNDGVFDHGAFDQLGNSWRLLDPGIDVKRTPLCLSSQAAVDGIRSLITEYGLAAADVARVICDVPPGAAANLAYTRPGTAQEAQFSMNFAIAAAIVFGDVALVHLDPAVLDDPLLGEMMRRVEMLTSARWNDAKLLRRSPEGAFVSVLTRNGERLERFSAAACGTALLPFTDAEIDAKFIDCTSPVIGLSQGEMLLGRLHGVAVLSSARDLLRGIEWNGVEREAFAGAAR